MAKTKLISLLLLFCSSLWAVNMAFGKDNLKFDPDDYTVKTVTVAGQSVTFRSYENILYVANPVEPGYQRMNLYIPIEYFEGKTVNGYTAKTAPIFLPNKVGGFMPGDMVYPGKNPRSKTEEPNAQFVALRKGLVVAAPAIRGRSLVDVWGQSTGKAPAFIVDYKAAVRYLRYNDKRIPGDAERIISDGTSAGGSLSALLAGTGNSKDYEPYLKELGAAKARDDIFAAQVYCPVADIENLSAGYEWMYNVVHTMKNRDGTILTLTPEQIDLALQLKASFITYLNSSNLKDTAGNPLTLDADGNGSFKDYAKSYVIACAQKALDAGEDMTGVDWMTVENGKVKDVDFDDKFVKWVGRVKQPPGWDALNLSAAENEEFGTATVKAQHISEFSYQHSTVQGTRADPSIIKMMNVFAYIKDPSVSVAKHWRVRLGIKDGMLATPLMVATAAANRITDSEFALQWGQGHAGDYDLPELFAWIERICPPDGK